MSWRVYNSDETCHPWFEGAFLPLRAPTGQAEWHHCLRLQSIIGNGSSQVIKEGDRRHQPLLFFSTPWDIQMFGAGSESVVSMATANPIHFSGDFHLTFSQRDNCELGRFKGTRSIAVQNQTRFQCKDTQFRVIHFLNSTGGTATLASTETVAVTSGKYLSSSSF